MTYTEITRTIVHYNKVMTVKSYGIYKYTLIERIFASVMKKYYTYKWEHYFDEEKEVE